MAVHDPLADLKAEIAAEEAAADAAEKTAADEPGAAAAAAASDKDESDEGREPGEEQVEDDQADDADEQDGEDDADADADADEQDAAADDDKKPAKKDTIPKARLAEETQKRRQSDARAVRAEREAAELRQRLDAVTNPKLDKDGKPIPKTPEQERQELFEAARQQARMEIRVENFQNAGTAAFGAEFDEACDSLSELGAPAELIVLALEATETPKQAAKAIFLLSKEEPEVIKKFLTSSGIKQGVMLGKLAAKPTAKADKDEEIEEEKPRVAAKKADVSRAPAPIKPVKGSRTVPDGFGDDVPDDVFTKRFEENILNPQRARH